MDIPAFLDSVDVAKYWRTIAYDCPPLQQAFIVRRSHRVSLTEKHAAWNEMIKASHDCPVAFGHRKINMGIAENLAASLHEFLRAYMALQDDLSDMFYRKDEKAAYHYKTCNKGDSDWYEDRRLYETAEEIFTNARANEDSDFPTEYLKITKQWFGKDMAITLTACLDGTIMDINANGLSEQKNDLLQAFDWMWFDFPTPFRKGDIVMSKHKPFGLNMFAKEPFVLTNLCNWGSRELKVNKIPDEHGEYESTDKRLSWLKEGGDATDMTAYGYFQCDDGRIYHECMHAYFDLEYYREKPGDIRRILTAFSAYVKKEIDGELLSKAYHIFMEEEKIKRDREDLSCFIDEKLRIAGLK